MAERSRRLKVALTLLFVVYMLYTSIALLEAARVAYEKLPEPAPIIKTNHTRDSQAVKSSGFDEKGVPKHYYETARKLYPQLKKHDRVALRTVLSNLSFPPYKMDEFDCSESAAYLEWILEGYGFNASIVYGIRRADDMEGAHTWVAVQLDDGDVIYVEATALSRVPGGGWFEYYNEIHKYNSIYDLLSNSGLPLSEVDWWNYSFNATEYLKKQEEFVNKWREERRPGWVVETYSALREKVCEFVSAQWNHIKEITADVWSDILPKTRYVQYKSQFAKSLIFN